MTIHHLRSIERAISDVVDPKSMQTSGIRAPKKVNCIYDSLSTARLMTEQQSPPTAASSTDAAELLKKARHIHARVLVLDSHIDFEPADLTGARNYTQRLETQFNLPNMIDGGLDGLFFVIYVGQTRESQNPDALKAAGYQRASKAAVEKFDPVNRFTRDISPGPTEFAFSADEIRRMHAKGKKAALMGVENGYPLGEDLNRLK